MLSKILGGTTMLAGAAALILMVLLQMERVKTARLEGRLEVVRQNVEILKGAVADQKSTIDGLLDMAKQNQENINEYFSKSEAANAKLLAAQQQINDLRASEEQKALAAPFERGNAAALRFNRSLCIISGKGAEGGDCDDQKDPDSE